MVRGLRSIHASRRSSNYGGSTVDSICHVMGFREHTVIAVTVTV